ncbi:MAG: hypothetical protein ABSG52_14205 [Terriglobales bacterium]|jgi:hypothetical protein
MPIHGEEWIASLIAAAGVSWAIGVAATSMLPAYAMELTVGPLETCAIGILIWLHAKWRRTLKAH